MAFEGLSEKLTAAFKRLRGKGRLTENDVREAMREVRLALLEADVSYKVVKEFVATVTERAVGTDVLDSLTPAEAKVYIERGHFAPGSMLPKVRAAVEFAESAPGRTALITLLEKAKDGVAGRTGTVIHQ